MKITTLVDDSEGPTGGYSDRAVVSLYLTPGEAQNLRVALGDLLAAKDNVDPGWHVHVRAWDETCEVVLMLDRDGAQQEPTPEEHLNGWLRELAASGGSVVRAVNAVVEVHQVDVARAKAILREHPAWRDRL